MYSRSLKVSYEKALSDVCVIGDFESQVHRTNSYTAEENH